MRHYLFITVNDVEPFVFGPYKTNRERDLEAGKHRHENGNSDGIFRLDVDKRGYATTWEYSNAEISKLMDEVDINTPRD